jgi:hypothetical protein
MTSDWFACVEGHYVFPASRSARALLSSPDMNTATVHIMGERPQAPAPLATVAYLPIDQLTASESVEGLRRNVSMAARIVAGNGWLLDDRTGRVAGRLDIGAVLAALLAEAGKATTPTLAETKRPETMSISLETGKPSNDVHPAVEHAAE